MKIKLIVVGKTDFAFVDTGCTMYFDRVRHYIDFEMVVVKDVKATKSTDESRQRLVEGERLMSLFAPADTVVLLDENGTEMTSRQLAAFIEKKSLASTKSLLFVIGGAYGFAPDVYARANGKIALSQMTFSHQLVRLIFAEQLYRAFTIIRNEPYHHA